MTTVIDAYEERDVMSLDVPNAFIQTLMPSGEDDERVFMKITGVLVDMLVQVDPARYGPYVVYENGRKVLYVQLLRVIYGMIQAALLWYQKFRKDLEGIGFKFNPYDGCVANRTVNKKQHTIRFHVDDLLSSHVDKAVNDKFEKWLQKMYGTHGKVVAVRGREHTYLGMKIRFNENRTVEVDMREYVGEMIEDLPFKLKSTDIATSPAGDNLFSLGANKPIDKKRADTYHSIVAKGLFVCKRARPDIQPTVAVLCSRVQRPNEGDWQKLIRMLKYLNGTRNQVMTMSSDNLQVIKWYVDASFAVHPDFKSHTGGVMKWGDNGRGTIIGMSRKQKLNTRSSTEAELVGVDDMATMILWTKLFLEEQGYRIRKNILYQDNKSAILLEENGKRSSGKRTRALNIRYFFITDQVEKGNVSIEYCPTDEMFGDFMTKPTQGQKFKYFRDELMGIKWGNDNGNPKVRGRNYRSGTDVKGRIEKRKNLNKDLGVKRKKKPLSQ